MDFRSSYSNRSIFLTGHTGFKGSWLSEWLLSLGAKITGYSVDIPTNPSLFEELGLAKRFVADMRGDVRDLSSVKKAMEKSQPSIVFHLAAQPLVRASYDDPVGTFSANIMGTANVLEACRHVKSVKAVVVVTTDKVYENVDAGRAFKESDPLGGHDPYSASKAGAEIVFSSYARSFLNGSSIAAASARAGNVIGGGDWATDRLVPDCARAWRKGEKVTVRNPKSVRPWQHVLEPLSGYLRLGQMLLEKPEGVAGEAFNFGPDAELTRSTSDLVKEMEKTWTGASHVIQDAAASDGKKEAALLSLDAAKARKKLGWHPQLNFSDTVSWTADWYKNAGKPADALKLTQEQIARFAKL
jgi:CDP-glucose 4,6-dehydratase